VSWEDICDGCAACCDIGGGVACPSLGPDKRCTVYERRTEVERCVKVTPKNLQWLHQTGVLPDSCAYIDNGVPSKEYTLIPFVLASEGIQRKYIEDRALSLKFRGHED
jgi:uncharacterized cysteine cluster protein YcgN (CxxCxxCC family)